MDFFEFEGNKITVIQDGNGKPWFIAKEACNILGLANVAMAVKHLDNDEKNSITLSDLNQRGTPNRIIINEPGLYNLINKSTKPEAKAFSRWIRHEVLPSIRKTGSYSMQPKIEEKQTIKELAVPKTFLEAMKLAVKVIETNVKLEADLELGRRVNTQMASKLEVMIPKARGYDQIHSATGLVRVTDCAKIIGIKPHELGRLCREVKIFYIALGKNIPFQKYIDQGWFKLVQRPAKDDPSHTYRQTFVTPKGVHKLKELFNPNPPGAQRRLFG